MGRVLPSLGRKIGRLTEVDIRNMRLFRQVVDANGMTAATERYGLELSTISRALRALEERLDGVLCLRGPQGFSVTEYGRQVYRAAAVIEDSVDYARNAIGEAHRSLEGEVRLGLADNCLTNPDAKISDAIEVFFKIAPAVRISVSIHPPDALIAAIRGREVHIGIVSTGLTNGSLTESGLDARPLFAERASLYCCPQADETPPHLERLTSRGYGIVQRRFLREGPAQASRSIKAAWQAEASGIEAVATLINTGRCVGFLPDHYVEGTRTRRPFVQVPGSENLTIQTTFCAVTDRSRATTQAVAAMYGVLGDLA